MKTKVAKSSKAVKEVPRVKRKYTRRAVKVEKPQTETANNTVITGENINMTELFTALTNLAKEATIYLASINSGVVSTVTSTSTVAGEKVAETVIETEVAPKRGRRTKAEIAANEVVTAPAAQVDDLMDTLGLPSEPAKATVKAAKPLTEEQSLKILMEMAEAYVGHFGKPEGIVKAKAHLKPFNVKLLTDLNHEQRIKFIAILKDELEMVAA